MTAAAMEPIDAPGDELCRQRFRCPGAETRKMEEKGGVQATKAGQRRGFDNQNVVREG